MKMKKNVKLRIIMSSETLEKIRQLAKEQHLAMSTYCMKKIDSPPELARIEFLLEDIKRMMKHG